MNRTLLGALSALLLVAAGLFWWQGRAVTALGAPPPPPVDALAGDPDALPSADVGDMRGPAPPEASEVTREQRRFNRLDRDMDGRITRNEMLATRSDDFRKLDTDGNNLLTFEEWAVATGNRFKGADANGDGWLSRTEFATTRPKPPQKAKCRC